MDLKENEQELEIVKLQKESHHIQQSNTDRFEQDIELQPKLSSGKESDEAAETEEKKNPFLAQNIEFKSSESVLGIVPSFEISSEIYKSSSLDTSRTKDKAESLGKQQGFNPTKENLEEKNTDEFANQSQITPKVVENIPKEKAINSSKITGAKVITENCDQLDEFKSNSNIAKLSDSLTESKQLAQNTDTQVGFQSTDEVIQTFEKPAIISKKASEKVVSKKPMEWSLKHEKFIGNSGSSEQVENLENILMPEESLKSKLVGNQSCERVQRIGWSCGTAEEPEIETDIGGGYYAQLEQAELKQEMGKSKEVVSQVGLSSGFVPQKEVPEELSNIEPKKDVVLSKITENKTKEIAARNSKNMVLNVESMGVKDTKFQNPQCEKVQSSRISENLEKPQKVVKVEGFCNEEEPLIDIETTFVPKTKNANEKDIPIRSNETALKFGCESGYQPPYENLVAEDFEILERKFEHIDPKRSKSLESEKTCAQNIGEALPIFSVNEDDISQIPESICIEQGVSRSKSNERASKNVIVIGKKDTYEIGELFNEKFSPKNSSAKESLESKSKFTKIVRNVQEIVINPEEELMTVISNIPESVSVEQKVSRNHSIERAARVSNAVGRNEENDSVKISQDKYKPIVVSATKSLETKALNEKAIGICNQMGIEHQTEDLNENSKNYRSEPIPESLIEKPHEQQKFKQIQRSVETGYFPVKEDEQPLESNIPKAEIGKSSNVPNELSQKITKQANRVGFKPSSVEAAEIKSKLDATLAIKPTRDQYSSTEKAISTSLQQGVQARPEETEEFIRKTEKKCLPNVKRTTSKSSERISLNPVEAGFQSDNQKSERFETDSFQKEIAKEGERVLQKPKRAVSQSKRIGFKPIEGSTENIQNNNKREAKANKLQEAKVLENAKRMSIVSAVEDKNQSAADLVEKAIVPTNNVEETIEHDKNSSKPLILGQCLGFVPLEELSIDQSIQEAKAEKALEVFEDKRTITAQPNIINVLEETSSMFEQVPNINRQGNQKVERESRSRAVKQDKKIGVSVTAAEVIQTIAQGTNPSQSIEKSTVQEDESLNFAEEVTGIKTPDKAKTFMKKISFDGKKITADENVVMKAVNIETAENMSEENVTDVQPFEIFEAETEKIDISSLDETDLRDTTGARRKKKDGEMSIEEQRKNVEESVLECESVEPIEAKKLRSKKINLANREGDLKKADKTDDAEIFFRKKLRKTDVVKQDIEKPKLKEVKLKHHDFESEPKEDFKEEQSSVKLGKLLEIIKDNFDQGGQKSSKKKIKKPKEKLSVDSMEVESPVNEHIDMKTDGDIPKSPFKKGGNDIQKTVEPKEQFPDKVEQSVKSEEPGETFKSNLKKVKAGTKKKEENVSEKTENVEIIFGKKLRKAETVKRNIEEAKIEKVQLKHHAFELSPLEPCKEQKSSVKLGKLLALDIENMKEKKKMKKPKKTPKELLSTAIDSEDDNTKRELELIGEILITQNLKSTREEDPNCFKTTTEIDFDPFQEEVIRKERDPIAVPEAAISKKHSDSGKVEVPSYVNFPSEQGISVEQQSVNESPFIEMPEEEITFVSEHESLIEEISPKKKFNKIKVGKKEPISNKLDKTNDHEIGFGKKLRKAETVKRNIEQPKLEEVQLKHHAFELKPKDVLNEEKGSVRLGMPLKSIKDNEEETNKKSSKRKKKKINSEFREIPIIVDEPSVEVKTPTETEVGFCYQLMT